MVTAEMRALIAVVTGVLTVLFLFSRYPFDRRPPSLVEAVVVLLLGGLAAYGLWRFGLEPRPWTRRIRGALRRLGLGPPGERG